MLIFKQICVCHKSA